MRDGGTGGLVSCLHQYLASSSAAKFRARVMRGKGEHREVMGRYCVVGEERVHQTERRDGRGSSVRCFEVGVKERAAWDVCKCGLVYLMTLVLLKIETE